MPSVKHPCLECKERHVKCEIITVEIDQVGVTEEENRPQCQRCLAKGLPCHRSGRKTSFRPGSSARYDTQFSSTQNWVNSNAREYRLQTSKGLQSHKSVPKLDAPLQTSSTEIASTPQCYTEASDGFTLDTTFSNEFPCSTGSPGLSLTASGNLNSSSPPQPTTLQEFSLQTDSLNDHSNFDSRSIQRPSTQIDRSLTQLFEPFAKCQPFEDIQEACLFRYFVEELSHWFDLCDENKHFQLSVPIRARRFPPLLHAILATSARHLSRLPQYKTPQGVLYHDQLLPNLTATTAVEYMLRCIPALREFHETQDEHRRELIVVTAVILRQFEEMEDEDDDLNASTQERVNFLAIINAVVRSSHSKGLFHQQGLFNAAYWIALRQEVYYSLTRKHSPQMLLDANLWQDASMANKIVMHAAQVAKWLWDDKSEHEWLRLKEQEAVLDQQVSDEYTPILRRDPDKSKGEVLPTIWYGSELVVTGIQHIMISKMVLAAESPFLRKIEANARAANRNMETEVRLIVLDLCGIAIQHPRSQPNLVNATIGIILYGDFFTDQWEREALAGVVRRFKNVCAWPLSKALRLFI